MQASHSFLLCEARNDTMLSKIANFRCQLLTPFDVWSSIMLGKISNFWCLYPPISMHHRMPPGNTLWALPSVAFDFFHSSKHSCLQNKLLPWDGAIICPLPGSKKRKKGHLRSSSHSLQKSSRHLGSQLGTSSLHAIHTLFTTLHPVPKLSPSPTMYLKLQTKLSPCHTTGRNRASSKRHNFLKQFLLEKMSVSYNSLLPTRQEILPKMSAFQYKSMSLNLAKNCFGSGNGLSIHYFSLKIARSATGPRYRDYWNQ